MTDENIKSWKCRRRKILQANSVGRVRVKLIVRDFSDLQPRDVITILAILSGKSRSHLSKKSMVTYLKQIVHKASELLLYRKENWHKTRKARDMSRNHQVTLIKVFSDLKD